MNNLLNTESARVVQIFANPGVNLYAQFKAGFIFQSAVHICKRSCEYCFLIGITSFLFLAVPAQAWDGFDADSADLVEITPDSVPTPGETVTGRKYDNNTTDICVVTAVKRNSRTTEVQARCDGGSIHTYVMEGR